MATYRATRPCVVALNCMEGCRSQAARLSDLFSFEVVGLSEGMLEKLETADVVIIHSLHYLPRAAQRKLSPSQLLLCLGSSVDTRVVESSLAEELGLRLLHVDVPRTDEVADSVLALILGLLRRTHVLAAQGCTSASWFAGFKSAWHGMRRLNGMTLGLVGAGETARAVALRALAFGMKVHFVDIEKVSGWEGWGGEKRGSGGRRLPTILTFTTFLRVCPVRVPALLPRDPPPLLPSSPFPPLPA